MRIHNIIIAIIVMSLFAVVLYSNTTELFSGSDPTTTKGLGIEKANYTDDGSSKNATGILHSLEALTSTQSAVADIGDKAPGGKDSSIPISDTTTNEGLLAASGLGVVTKVGVFLFSVPRTLIQTLTQYLGLNPAFATAATTILVLIVAIILVSSILRNRL